MSKIFTLLLLLGPSVMAQKISVSGTVRNSAGLYLSQATVLVLDSTDSSLVNFTSTDDVGHFELKNLAIRSYEIRITYVGYMPFAKILQSDSSLDHIDLGVIVLEDQVHVLDAAEVESQRAAVTLKKDTIEFNASSFKTPANAVVEDLLKKLPGVEVDADGTIRAQGKEVERVTVDGKNFFGNDPKIATRNLPADAVDKIQVFDKKSDQAEFSGIDDGERNKTINLALKENKRNGVFGNTSAGGGSDDRYQSRTNLNRFRKDEQISLLGMANNVNEQGFGIEEYMNFTGGSKDMMSGGRVRVQLNSDNQNGIPLNFGGRPTGVLSSIAGGVNYNKEFTPKTELNTSYFFSQLEHDINQDLERINFFEDKKLKFNQHSRQANENQNHQINIVANHKIDSMNSIKLTTNAKYNYTDSFQKSTSRNLNSNSDLLNESERTTLSSGQTAALSANFLWRHKFGKKGRTLSSNFQVNHSQSDRNGDQQAVTHFYTPQDRMETLRQLNDQKTETTTTGAGISYTEPLGKRRYLEANYSFLKTYNQVDKNVFDLNGTEQIFNDDLSNEYTSDYQYHRAGVNMKVNRPDYNLTFGGALQQSYLRGDLISLDQQVSRSYSNFLPSLRVTYDFSESRHFEMSYETSVDEPSVQELQPIVDNSDPLNLYQGNPRLRPAYEHNVRLEFASFDQATFVNLFAFLEATQTQHAITTSQRVTEEQIRISEPVNVSGKRQLNSDITFGFPLTKIKSRISLSANWYYERGVNILNDVDQKIVQQRFGGRARYDFSFKELIDFGVSANLSEQTTKYQFSEQGDQRYLNQTYRLEGNISFLKNYQFNTAFEYLVYDNKSLNFRQKIPLLNLSVSRFVLKNKSGEIKLAAVNVLDRSIGVNQSSSINYTERSTSDSLGAYVLLSFTYALNKHFNPLAGRPGGRQIRIMR